MKPMQRYHSAVLPLFFLFLLSEIVYSQEFKQVCTLPGQAEVVSKFWSASTSTLIPQEWKAFWIWRKGETSGTNLFLLARKSFSLEKKPEQAMIYITADNIYELYVNGILVNRGPARCQPHHQFYDVLDIAPLLNAGRNVLAIRALHKASYGSYNLPPRPGLLAQLEIKNGDNLMVIGTNESFKVSRVEGFDLNSEVYSELADFRKAQNEWTELNFDDSNWENAEELVSDRYLSWPGPSPKSRPQTLTSPWKIMIPRDIPYLTVTQVKARNVLETGEILELGFYNPVSDGLHGLLFPLEKSSITGIEEYKKETGPITIKNSYPSGLFTNDAIYSSYLIFDLGEIMHGYPRLEIEGEPGTIVEILYSPSLFRGKFPMRSNLEGRPMRRPSTEKIILGNGVTQWDAMELKYLRYLLIAFRNTDKPVKLSYAGLQRADYPFQPNGSFSAGRDEELNWLWHAGKNTLDVVTTEAFQDNYRERLQYSQTSYYASRCSYAAYGDPWLQRRYLMQIALEQQSDGILPASAPVFTNAGQRFLDASIFWILGLHDYFLHSGDSVTVRELLPAAEKVLSTFRLWENKEGFIDSPPYTYWIDHAAMDRYGASFSLNALYLLAMQDVMRIAEWLGQDQKAMEYRKRIDYLKRNMQTKFWDPDQKLFREVHLDGMLAGKFTEHGNSLAIVAGIASSEQQREIVKEMVQNKSARMVQAVLFMHYIAEALFVSEHGQEALVLLKDRYRHMKAAGSQTLWEEWSQTVTYRSGEFVPSSHITVSQAENTFICYTLSKWLLGITPSKPGMQEVVISFNNFELPVISGSFPTPKGNIEAAWFTTKKGVTLELTVPDGISAVLDLNSLGKYRKTILLDEIDITDKATGIAYMSIYSGVHRFEFKDSAK
jgi:hypothetical protein